MATINGTFNSLIAGTLSGTVATPGATGPAGPAGPAGPQGVPGAPGVGVPAGGTTGQFLTKSSNLDYATGWSTLSLAGYATESWVTAGFYPLTGNPSGFLTASALTPYLTKADNLGSLTNFATARDNLNLGTLNNPTFAGLTLQGSGANVGQYTPTSLSLTHTTFGSFVISPSSGITFPDTSIQTTAFVAGSGLPTGGTVGQVLTKNSGTNFDASFQTLIPGDRYLTTSTTSNTINNGNKTFTIGTGLSYTPTQNITISYDASNHMHGEVLTYNSGTGVLTVDVNHHTGSGTYSAWVVNVGGVTPATSVAWGSLTGTLSSQTDLQNALDLKLAATTAASTYQTQSGMSDYLAKADNLSGLASTSTARSNLGLGSLAVVNDAPADGSQYARKNNAWEVVSGGGGGGSEADFGFHFADLIPLFVKIEQLTVTGDGADPETFTWTLQFGAIGDMYNSMLMTNAYQYMNTQYSGLNVSAYVYDDSNNLMISFPLGSSVAGSTYFYTNYISQTSAFGGSGAFNIKIQVELQNTNPSLPSVYQSGRFFIYRGSL